MMRSARALAAVLLALGALGALGALASGCAGTETGNPYTAALTYGARSSDPAAVGIDPSGGAPVIVESVWMSVAELHLDEFGGCALPSGPPSDGPRVVELVSPGEPVRPALASGAYCGARVVTGLATAPLPGGAPPELAGATLVLSGRVGATPFVASVDMPRTLTLLTDAGAFLLDGDHPALVLALDVAPLLSGIDLASIAPDATGTIHVDSGHTPALAATLDAATPAALGLFHDDDADGHVSDAEALHPLAHGAH